MASRTFSVLYLSLSILIMLLLFVVVIDNSSSHTDDYNKAFALTNRSSSASSASSSIPKAKQDTFSAIGTISSLVITVPTKSADGFNITNAFKVILTGEWNLNVRKGNVTNFAANFLASPMDGTKPHIHQITNFKKASTTRQPQIVQLIQDNNSLSINGTVDVKINGVIVWHNVHVSILISKGNTVAIRLNDKDTQNHFGQQPVLGIVNRLIL